MIHEAVLAEEVIEKLNLKPGDTVVDGTLGAGGHSIEILKKILPGGKLISIDWDKGTVKNFEKKLESGISIAKRELIQSVRSVPININKKNNNQAFSHFIKLGNREGKIVGYWRGATDNYANLKKIIRGLGIHSADAVFIDLGFSSDQIEDRMRGFSFLRNGPLDMRYSRELQEKTAADIVNKYTPRDLIRILNIYGEERYARNIARGIIKAREISEIRETQDLVKIISDSVPEKYKRGKLHFAARTFQALRIETNQELENLNNFLKQAVEVLASEGRLAIISFHSLEDRIVKNFMRTEALDCVCPPNFPKCVCNKRQRLKIITKKPVTASVREIDRNPRARSAKLRVAEKI